MSGTDGRAEGTSSITGQTRPQAGPASATRRCLSQRAAGWAERARMLVELHTSLFEVDAVGVRMTLTQTPLCPSLHLSRQHCQLLTALAGDGTQWVRGALYAVNETSVVEQLPSAAVTSSSTARRGAARAGAASAATSSRTTA